MSFGCARTLTILHVSLSSKHGPANELLECEFSVGWGVPASRLIHSSWVVRDRPQQALWSCSVLSSPLPPCFISCLHVGICMLFQVTYHAAWGTDLLLVRQALQADYEVHVQLEDSGMGPRWAWGLHVNFSWLSCPRWAMPALQGHLSSFSHLRGSSPITPQSKMRKKMKVFRQSFLSMQTVSFQKNSAREAIIT